MNRKYRFLLSSLIIGLLLISLIFYVFYLNLFSLTDSKDDDSDNSLINEPIIESVIPEGIRLTFIDNINDSIVLSWFTTKNATNPGVNLSNKSDLSYSIFLRANVSYIDSFFLYHARLIKLEANKTYFYQISSDIQNKREIMNFTTLANNPNITRFLVYGDSRTQRLERKILAYKIMENFRDKFDILIHTGDIVEFGSLQYQWNDYFMDTEILTRNKQGIYVEGNHEGGDATKMYENLLMKSSNENRYYAFTYNNIGFIILNSNPDAVNDDEQTNWLNQTLIDFSQKNIFNFAYLHHPLLHDRIDFYFQEKWRPLFDKYNTSIIFCGHNHHYERSYPILNPETLEFEESELYDYFDLTDPIYIVSGGAGAPLKSLYNDLFIVNNERSYHFVIVEIQKEIDNYKLSLETWGMPEDFGDLYLFDNITITKWN